MKITPIVLSMIVASAAFAVDIPVPLVTDEWNLADTCEGWGSEGWGPRGIVYVSRADFARHYGWCEPQDTPATCDAAFLAAAAAMGRDTEINGGPDAWCASDSTDDDCVVVLVNGGLIPADKLPDPEGCLDAATTIVSNYFRTGEELGRQRRHSDARRKKGGKKP